MITRIVLAACVVCAVTLPAAAVDSETMRYLVNCSADQGGQVRVDACTGLLDGRALPPSVKPLYIYENRAAAYEDIGRLDEARRDLDKGVDLAGPEDKFGALYSRGLFLSSMTADRDAALADLSAAIALDPNQARVYMQRGNTYRLMKRYDEAFADLNRALQLDPNYAEAIENRALTYFAMGDNDRAIADHDKAIALKPDFAAAYVNRGSAYSLKEMQERAIADYDKGISLNPTFGQAFVNRGRAYLALQKPDRAANDLEVAISLRPNDALAYYYLGKAYYQIRQPQRAIATFDKALALAPGDPSVLKVRQAAEDMLKSMTNKPGGSD